MSKHYVVWHGHEPGIYSTWDECRRQVEGFKGAAYKSFTTEAEARAAYAAGPPAQPAVPTVPHDKQGKPHSRKDEPPQPPDWRNDTVLPLPPEVRADAIAVDAACSGNPGPMEYRGVCLDTGQELFHFGPVWGTNNIGEFLAIVHALALLKQQGRCLTVYSDSRNALLWVKARKCRTKLPRTTRTEALFGLIERAERWLDTHDWADIPLIKWDTARWGEVPADFGRK